MKRNLLFAAIALAGVSQANATCFVNEKASGKNDGSSWTDAFVDLQDAVNSTVCSEIWVAEGVYKPGASGDDTAMFNLRSGVALYGGFAGSESSVADRNLSLHKSVLSGDVDSNDAHAATDEIDQTADDISGDNSGTLLSLIGRIGYTPITTSTVVDGFTLTGASDFALICDGTYGGECSPVLSNLTITGNESPTDGAAMLFDASESGSARPTISDSLFKGNTAQNGGGAILAVSNDRGTLDLKFNNVVFDSNNATHRAGAIWVDAEFDGGQNTIEINNSRFTNNSSGAGGGAIYAETNDSGMLEIDVAGTTFDSNNALYGGAIYAIANGAQLIGKFTNSTFDGNSSIYDGGAISLTNLFSPVATMHSFNNVTFHGNHADGDGMVDGAGGAIEVYTNPPVAGAGLSVTNTILSGDLSTKLSEGPEIHNTYGYSVVTIDHSVVTGTCPDDTTCTNVSSADPLLNPLGHYFSTTPVMRPGIGGSAIDFGDDATCEATDQRGFARPQGAHCDIGAVEMRQPSDDILYPSGF
jgi:predicted outer membrane repeat protein